MTPRRPLGDTLLDVALGAIDASGRAPGVAVTRLSVSLPIEIAMTRRGGDWWVLGDLPRTVTRTAFDTGPSRVEVVWVAGDRS